MSQYTGLLEAYINFNDSYHLCFIFSQYYKNTYRKIKKLSHNPHRPIARSDGCLLQN